MSIILFHSLVTELVHQDKFGDQYMVFLLYNPEENKPVAIVTLKELVEPDPPSKNFAIF